MLYHYHVRAGHYGVLPTVNRVYTDKGQALNGLTLFANQAPDIDGVGDLRRESCSGWVHGSSVHFKFGDGQNYGEITRCGDRTCQIPHPIYPGIEPDLLLSHNVHALS